MSYTVVCDRTGKQNYFSETMEIYYVFYCAATTAPVGIFRTARYVKIEQKKKKTAVLILARSARAEILIFLIFLIIFTAPDGLPILFYASEQFHIQGEAAKPSATKSSPPPNKIFFFFTFNYTLF